MRGGSLVPTLRKRGGGRNLEREAVAAGSASSNCPAAPSSSSSSSSTYLLDEGLPPCGDSSVPVSGVEGLLRIGLNGEDPKLGMAKNSVSINT